MEIKKKDLKNFNDHCKNLNHDKYYSISNGVVFSYEGDEDETSCLCMVQFKKEIYNEIINRAEYIDGAKIGKVISGTGLEINIDKNHILLSSSVKSKVSNEKETIEYNTSRKHRQNDLINQRAFIRYMPYIKILEKGSTDYVLNKKEIQKLLEKKKFTANFSDKLNVSLLKISNKMMKNFSKNVEKVTIHVSNDSIQYNASKSVIRVLCIEIEDSEAITKSYYTFLDY